MLAPCFANLSVCSLPFIPQCVGIYCRTTLLCSNTLYSLRLKLCSPWPASESNTDRESVRNNNNNNNNCLKSNIQCIEIRVQWTVHLGSSHMHVHAVTRVHAVTPKLVICVMYLTSI